MDWHRSGSMASIGEGKDPAAMVPPKKRGAAAAAAGGSACFFCRCRQQPWGTASYSCKEWGVP